MKLSGEKEEEEEESLLVTADLVSLGTISRREKFEVERTGGMATRSTS